MFNKVRLDKSCKMTMCKAIIQIIEGADSDTMLFGKCVSFLNIQGVMNSVSDDNGK